MTMRKGCIEVENCIKKKCADIRTKVHYYLCAAYGKDYSATGGFISRLMAGAADMKRKIAGEVCTALGDTAGPCVGQFVPNPGTGESADVTLNSNAAVTVPVYGVPVKVGEGAAVKLSREGHDSKKYKVTEPGEGLIAVVAPKAGGEGAGEGSVD